MNQYNKIYIDVTSTISVKFVTGIQRVVREFTSNLIKMREDIVLLAYDSQYDEYQIVEEADYVRKLNGSLRKISPKEYINIAEIGKGSLFLELDSNWNNQRQRRVNLFKKLKDNGASLGVLVYDIIPISHPQYCHIDTANHFLIWLSAVLEYADFLIVNSESTKKKVQGLISKTETKEREIFVVPLGSNIKNKEYALSNISSNISSAAESGKYLLMVGTIEPRKNHKLLIEAYEKSLKEENVNIIFAGRTGWNMEEFLTELKNKPYYGERVFFFEKPSDEEIAFLYANATAVVVASFEEGFGLPIIESFYYGTPVIASDIDVFHEVAGELAEYFSPVSWESLALLAVKYLEEEYRESYRKRLSSYQILKWEESTRLLSDAIGKSCMDCFPADCEDMEVGRFGKIKVKQIFFITARVDDIVETLPYYEKFMPYLKEAVICSPTEICPQIKAAYNGNLSLSFLTDEELTENGCIPRDHATRNFYLRSLAISGDTLDDFFIMADDDNRPLKEIPEDYFCKDGRIKLFFFYSDGAKWLGTPGRQTSFDYSMKNTASFLSKNGMGSKLFASHAPQLISKNIYLEALDAFPMAVGQNICEWSFYANYALKMYPKDIKAEYYHTLGWPALPSDWRIEKLPTEFFFENFYMNMYENGALFDGFSTNFYDGIENENIVKIRRDRDLFYKYLKKQNESDAFNQDTIWSVDLNKKVINTPKYYRSYKGFCNKIAVPIYGVEEDDNADETLKLDIYFLLRYRRLWHLNKVLSYVIPIKDGNSFELNIFNPPSELFGWMIIKTVINGKRRIKIIKADIL